MATDRNNVRICIKQYKDRDGYKYVFLIVNNKRYKRLVHRMILTTFIMSFGKSIGSYLVDIIKAEKNKDCDMCIKKKTMECPNSSLCYNTENKPYFKSKLDGEE